MWPPEFRLFYCDGVGRQEGALPKKMKYGIIISRFLIRFYQIQFHNIQLQIIGNLHQNTAVEIQSTKQKGMHTIGGFGMMRIHLSTSRKMYRDL